MAVASSGSCPSTVQGNSLDLLTRTTKSVDTLLNSMKSALLLQRHDSLMHALSMHDLISPVIVLPASASACTHGPMPGPFPQRVGSVCFWPYYRAQDSYNVWRRGAKSADSLAEGTNWKGAVRIAVRKWTLDVSGEETD